MRTIVSVQALRAIAALAVALCHFDEIRVWLAGKTGPYPLDSLASGVDLFFVISGFVMVYASEDLFETKGGWFRFFTRRISRIVPPYWLVTAIAIPVMSLPGDAGSLLGSYLFIPFRAASGSIVPIYGVGWTLNFEMYFYTLFSVFIFLRRNIAVPTICLIFSAIVLLGHWLQPTLAPLMFWSDPIILEFAFGMILAMIYINGIEIPTTLRIFLVVSGVIAIGLSTNTQVPPTGYRVLQWGIPAAMIFAGTILGREIDFGQLQTPVKTLGNSSYALYLLHSLMTAAVLLCWPIGLNRYPKMLVIFLAIVAVQLISIVMYYHFEKRSTRFLQGIFLAQAPRILTEFGKR